MSRTIEELREEELGFEKKYQEVYEKCKAGISCDELAAVYGVSKGTITSWCKKYEEIDLLMQDEVYCTLFEIAGYKMLATKAYSILKRYGYATKDAVIALSDEDIFEQQKWRNCGEVCKKLIAECRDVLKSM